MSAVPDGTPFLIKASEAEEIAVGANKIQLLADFDDTRGAVNANRTLLDRGTDGPPPHFHTHSSEIFFVLSGALEALAGERILTLEKGDFLTVPPHVPHAFWAPDDSSSDVLILFAPAIQQRFEYFRLGERVLKGQANPEEILDSQERFDNHFVESVVWAARRNGSYGMMGSTPRWGRRSLQCPYNCAREGQCPISAYLRRSIRPDRSDASSPTRSLTS
jgi:mannose-6-phosphate isomerase-like protein (cupin superfamily)